VKDRRRQRRGSFSAGQHTQKVVRFAGAPGGDHRHMRRPRNGARQLAVEALLDAVGIHGSQQDFSRAQFFAAGRPRYRIDALIVAPAACVDVPRSGSAPPRVNREHHGLCAEFHAQLGNQFGTPYGRGIDRDLVGAAGQDAARIRYRAYAAAHRQWDKDLARGSRHHSRHDLARVARGGDVQEDQFVGAFLVVTIRQLDRVPGIAQVHEVNALNHTAAGDVQARDDTLGEHP
jgi:hypothetical protein